jgi:hypothetical protein
VWWWCGGTVRWCGGGGGVLVGGVVCWLGVVSEPRSVQFASPLTQLQTLLHTRGTTPHTTTCTTKLLLFLSINCICALSKRTIFLRTPFTGLSLLSQKQKLQGSVLCILQLGISFETPLPGDKGLVIDLLEIMDRTGADFTNTFRSLSRLELFIDKTSSKKASLFFLLSRLGKHYARHVTSHAL